MKLLITGRKYDITRRMYIILVKLRPEDSSDVENTSKKIIYLMLSVDYYFRWNIIYGIRHFVYLSVIFRLLGILYLLFTK